MRKVVMLNRISIDGYFASFNEKTGGMDWFVQDPKVDKAVHGLESTPADTLLLGAKTYTMLQNSWVPMLKDPKTPKKLKNMAQELTNMTKVVFSHKLTSSSWENSRFVESDLPGTVKKLKRQKGSDILIMGSGTIVQQLTEAGLIDEYIFIVSPVIAGKGKALFKDVEQRGIVLVSNKSFASGNMV
ncbi:MAG: dihydrofolate reductase family protein, partial [Anaerolineales bacterium]